VNRILDVKPGKKYAPKVTAYLAKHLEAVNQLRIFHPVLQYQTTPLLVISDTNTPHTTKTSCGFSYFSHPRSKLAQTSRSPR